MLEVLVLAMTIMQEEVAVFGLQINWSKINILQVPPSSSSSGCLAQQSRWQVDMLKWSTPLSIWVA